MTNLPDFLERVADYENASGLATQTISVKLFGDRRTLGKLRSGGNATIRVISRAQERLAKLVADSSQGEAA